MSGASRSTPTRIFLRFGVMPPERRTDPKPASLIQALKQRIGDAKIPRA
jgi:hypothetical protein